MGAWLTIKGEMSTEVIVIFIIIKILKLQNIIWDEGGGCISGALWANELKLSTTKSSLALLLTNQFSESCFQRGCKIQL